MENNYGTLYKHQQKAIDHAVSKPYYALFFEQGCGKTRTVLEIIKAQGLQSPNALIIAPLITLRNWKNEMIAWDSKLKHRCYVLNHRSSKEKLKILSDTCDTRPTYIINYQSLLNEDIMKYLRNTPFDYIIIDEAHKIKSFNSKQTRKCLSLGEKYYTGKYILTGTPILNSLEDIYFPYKFLNGYKTFGTKNQFLDKYFFRIEQTTKRRNITYDLYAPKLGTPEALRATILRTGAIVKKEECLDLPKIIEQNRIFQLEDRSQYDDILSDEKIWELNQNTMFGKMQKLMSVCSGFVKQDDLVHTLNSDRITTLNYVLDELKANGINKAIIWCVFRHDYFSITSLLKNRGLKYVLCTGDQKDSEKQEAIGQFNKRNDTFFISNPKAGGIGINLTSANTMIFYNRTYSLEDYLQAQARCHRIGSEQHESILQINIVCEGTLDEMIVKSLKRKEQLSDSVLRDYLFPNKTEAKK